MKNQSSENLRGRTRKLVARKMHSLPGAVWAFNWEILAAWKELIKNFRFAGFNGISLIVGLIGAVFQRVALFVPFSHKTCLCLPRETESCQLCACMA